MTLYEKIKQAAKEKKVSITNLETACGLGNGTIGKWQTSTPKMSTLRVVADYLDMPIEYFLNTDAAYTRNNGNILLNSINESPNSHLAILAGESALSKQELELVLTYRELGIKEQAELISFLLKLKSE